MFEPVKRALLVGLGIQEKMKEYVDDLVRKGEVSKEQSGSLLKDLMTSAEKNIEGLDKSWREMIQSTMERMNLPTREDLEKLEKKVNALSRRLAKLDKGGEGEEE
jgi:polyhydroxyalkanoate synthesis regulator phasin